MEKTKIEWCDSTFNPITGCLHGCEYCYARSMANRFKTPGVEVGEGVQAIEMEEPLVSEKDGKVQPYPFGFIPTFHKYRLDQIRHWKNEKPKNVFICSMADMFGRWVHYDWKIEVLEALKQAPQHNYLFLTKDPTGYDIWPTKKHPDALVHELYTENMWTGVTFTGYDRLRSWSQGDEDAPRWFKSYDEYLRRMNGNLLPGKSHRFLSIEPLLRDVCEIESEDRPGQKLMEQFIHRHRYAGDFEWVIIGAESGNRTGKVAPKREWIEKLVGLCRKAEKPVFMKDSLVPIVGEENMLREFPRELVHDGKTDEGTAL